MNFIFPIKDKFFLGVFAAFIAELIDNSYDWIMYAFDMNKYHEWHIAASTYFPISKLHTIPALIVGCVADFTIAAILGVIIVYLLYWTGIDFYMIKGIGVTLCAWLIIFGAILRMKIGRIDPVDAGTNLEHLADHILLGILMSLTAVKFGKQLLNQTTDKI